MNMQNLIPSLPTLEMVKKAAESENNNLSGDYFLVEFLETGEKRIWWAKGNEKKIALALDYPELGYLVTKPIEQDRIELERLERICYKTLNIANGME